MTLQPTRKSTVPELIVRALYCPLSVFSRHKSRLSKHTPEASEAFRSKTSINTTQYKNQSEAIVWEIRALVFACQARVDIRVESLCLSHRMMLTIEKAKAAWATEIDLSFLIPVSQFHARRIQELRKAMAPHTSFFHSFSSEPSREATMLQAM